MQSIYNYIPETEHVCRVQWVAAVLYLQFVLHVMSFRLWNMFCTETLALSAVCVCAVSNMDAFCSSLISCFPCLLRRYCVSDFEMVPVAPIITSYYYYYYYHLLYAEYLYLSFWENGVAAILLLLFTVLISLVSVLIIIITIIIINVIFTFIIITNYILKRLTIYNIIRHINLVII